MLINYYLFSAMLKQLEMDIDQEQTWSDAPDSSLNNLKPGLPSQKNGIYIVHLFSICDFSMSFVFYSRPNARNSCVGLVPRSLSQPLLALTALASSGKSSGWLF